MSRELRGMGLSVAAVLIVGCSEQAVVAEGLTGLEVTVLYDADLALDQLLFTVHSADGRSLLAPTRRPEVPEPLTSGSSSVVILLPEAFGGQEVSVRIDAMAGGMVVVSGGALIVLTGRVLVGVEVVLGDKGWCGDGIVSSASEECDDGNEEDEDGCDSNCDVEREEICSGGDDVCGDGCCSGSESPVNCMQDCGDCGSPCRGGTCLEPCVGPNCSLDCSGDCGCAIDCTDINKCIPRCKDGASCSVDCIRAGQCNAICSGGADCEIDCSDAGNCSKSRCLGGAQCLIVCSGAANCAFDVCEGGETVCPGNVLVCNRPCPT